MSIHLRFSKVNTLSVLSKFRSLDSFKQDSVKKEICIHNNMRMYKYAFIYI